MTSPTIVAGVRQFLVAHPPFSMMDRDDVEFVATRLELVYFKPGETIIAPQDGAPAVCWIVKQGVVEGQRAGRGETPGPRSITQLAPGEIFPVGALAAERPVSSVYTATGDVFCWRLVKADFDELLGRSPVFLDFSKRRLAAMIDLSRAAAHASYAAQATQWRSMQAPLGSLLRRAPVTATPRTTLREVFERMESEHIGSVVIVRAASPGDPSGPGADSDGPVDPAPTQAATEVAGIFTRQDVLGRVVLAQRPLDTPIGEVMTSPVVTLDADDSIADAMLLMAQKVIRHIPVIRDGRLAGVVTERDLFVLQRRSIRQIGDSVRNADSVPALREAAADIREWSQSLVAQGVAPGFATSLISRLNDQVTTRLITLVARRRSIDLDGLCWLALGSEGREEQTIATDQDNGLLIADDNPAPIDTLLAFAREVNDGLDACGYPLCQGGVMAGNPRWCLTASRWDALFTDWIDRGDPASLLNANIFFDFRPLIGDEVLAIALRERVTGLAAANRRFLKQMSDNALRNGPPDSWNAGLIGSLFGNERGQVDLKLNGTAPFVDAARLLALAHGVAATGTAERLNHLARREHLDADEARGWIESFQFLQGLRLRVQQRPGVARSALPNRIDATELSDLDRRILKEAFRQARRLQQRLALDFPG